MAAALLLKEDDFELERLNAPSRWNTLRAFRVLGWWDRGSIRQEAGRSMMGLGLRR
jgi:hypothetical protein